MDAFSSLPIGHALTHRSARCTTHLWHPTPGVIVTRVEGYYTAEAAAFVDALARRQARVEARLLFLNDWWETDDYARETREILVKLGRDLHTVTDGNHILLQSKLIAFGVQAANLVLRNITTYTDRASFERALQDAIRTRGAAARHA